MSYNIGQFKRTDVQIGENYENLLKKELFEAGEDKKDAETNDGRVSFIGDNTFTTGQIYRLKTKLIPVSLNGTAKIKIKLKDGNNKYQILKIVNIKESASLDLVFIPQYSNFKHIVFEIDKDASTGVNSNTYVYAKHIGVDPTSISTLTNIISWLDGKITRLKRVGIQGPEGMAFVINGELLKMGKSRIFMSDEMDITSVCFIVEDLPKADPYFMENNVPFFIMDYQY